MSKLAFQIEFAILPFSKYFCRYLQAKNYVFKNTWIKEHKKKKYTLKGFYKQNRYGLLSSVMLWCKQMSKHCALCLNLFILVTMVRLHWISSVWIHYDLHQNNTVENSVPLTSLHFLLWLKIAAAGANFFAFELIAFSHIIIQTSFEILTCLIFFL